MYVCMYISFYAYLIAKILICDHRFHAVLTRQSSGRIKQIYIYLLLYNNSITDFEYYPNYTGFGIALILEVREWQP